MAKPPIPAAALTKHIGFLGTCDICEAQNVELVRSELAGLETWSCWEECPMERKTTDDKIEEAANKMIAGLPLTRAEQRLLDSPQADFAMGQVHAALDAKR